MGACSPFDASAFALSSSSFLMRALSSAYGSVTAAAPLFWATVVSLRNAALISMAPVRAHIQIPDNRFTRYTRNGSQSGSTICITHAWRFLQRLFTVGRDGNRRSTAVWNRYHHEW